MVGDTMETDILGGVGMGYKTVLVLSGHTNLTHLHRYAYKPDWIIESVDHMPDELFAGDAMLAGAV